MKQIWDKFSRWIIAVVVALAAALGAAGGASYTGAIAGKPSHIYQLTSVTSLIAGTSVAAGTTMIAGTSVAAGTTVAAGTSVTAGTKYIAAKSAAAITCADGATITPTATYQELTAAGTVEVTMTATSRTTGEILILWNSAAQAITIKDVNVDGTGDLALSQFDTAMYIFNGTKWAQLATSNN
jgi:hypothetical protein